MRRKRAVLDVAELPAPDGWICEITANVDGSFSPLHWVSPASSIEQAASAVISEGIRGYGFRSPSEAMMAAYRERLQRSIDVVERSRRPEKGST